MSPAAILRKWQEKLERLHEEAQEAIATCDKGLAEADAYLRDSRDAADARLERQMESRRAGY